ncbi:MAG: hypothetical protein CMB25_02075 [Euryarchaeota archaeon]|nr:hypothetical protein [Euryarchaeota archaeon]
MFSTMQKENSMGMVLSLRLAAMQQSFEKKLQKNSNRLISLQHTQPLLRSGASLRFLTSQAAQRLCDGTIQAKKKFLNNRNSELLTTRLFRGESISAVVCSAVFAWKRVDSHRSS